MKNSSMLLHIRDWGTKMTRPIYITEKKVYVEKKKMRPVGYYKFLFLIRQTLALTAFLKITNWVITEYSVSNYVFNQRTIFWTRPEDTLYLTNYPIHRT